MRTFYVVLATLALLLAVCGPTFGAPQLLDEPRGLAWSAAEVAAATRNTTAAVLEHAAQQQALGCRRRCWEFREVWRGLCPVFDAQQAAFHHRFDLRLVVVRLPEIDAFSAPDGTIVVSETFVEHERLDTAQLAFVLSHEVAHVLLQHERLTLTSALSLLPHGVQRNVPDIYSEFGYNLGLLIKLEPAMQQAEAEADEVGFELAAAAGFAPRRQMRFMARQVRTGPAGQAVAATHPAPAQRLAHLRGLLPIAQRLYESFNQGAGTEHAP